MSKPEPYLGSKNGAGVYQRIIGSMPYHDTYIEGFLGSGAIMRRKPPASRTLGFEIDAAVVAKYDYPSGAEIFNEDVFAFLKTLSMYDIVHTYGKTLVYLDPPYLASTRSSHHGYEYELSDDRHKLLLDIANSLPCDVMISGYPSKMYDEMLSGWRKWEFTVMTRGGVRRECLWFNFERGEPFHHVHAGKNRDERWRIKKKMGRWGERLAKLPPDEAMACFAACCEAMEARSGE